MLVADALKLNPPIQYDRIWLFIGLGLVLLIIIWYGVLFWITRRKKLKSLDSLRRLPTGAELERLKAKYIKLIDELYQRYVRAEISLRDLHRELSKAVRDFVFEAKGFPAPYLTLSDLRLTPYSKLTQLIGDYYPEEFALIGKGEATASVGAAKGFILQWPF